VCLPAATFVVNVEFEVLRVAVVKGALFWGDNKRKAQRQ
jgi:hypothetical protein